jgi:dimethylargininase
VLSQALFTADLQLGATFDAHDIFCLQDTVIFFDSVAVIARPGALSRRPETAAADRLVRSLGCRYLNFVRLV